MDSCNSGKDDDRTSDFDESDICGNPCSAASKLKSPPVISIQCVQNEPSESSLQDTPTLEIEIVKPQGSLPMEVETCGELKDEPDELLAAEIDELDKAGIDKVEEEGSCEDGEDDLILDEADLACEAEPVEAVESCETEVVESVEIVESVEEEVVDKPDEAEELSEEQAETITEATDDEDCELDEPDECDPDEPAVESEEIPESAPPSSVEPPDMIELDEDDGCENCDCSRLQQSGQGIDCILTSLTSALMTGKCEQVKGGGKNS